MSGWLVPFGGLTPEQIQVVRRPAQGRSVVFGLPGSGKTLCLVHRAHHLLAQRGRSEGAIHVFVYTNVLKDYIREGLADLEIPGHLVTTLDQWCANRYRQHFRRPLPKKPDSGEVDFDKMRAEVLRLIQRREFEHILVDEGQDLNETQWDILAAISSGMTVCMDFMQQVYETGTSEEAVWQKIGVNRREVRLLSLLRCSPLIIDLAASFIVDEALREAFRSQARTAVRSSETPVLYIASDYNDERRQLIDALKSRQSIPTSGSASERIGVLFPTRKQVYGFAKGLAEAGVEVEVPREDRRGDALNFTTDLPKVLTYHGAKGLTFDTVFLPRLTRKSFNLFRDDLLLNMLFVGVTRAVRWVQMSTTSGSMIEAVKRVFPLQDEGKLRVMRAPDLFTPPPPERTTQDDEDEDDVLDLLA